MIQLKPLGPEHMEEVYYWRCKTPESWRTSPPYTWNQQRAWCDSVVLANPRKGYYWALYDYDKFVGQGELSSWKNDRAEIGLMIFGDYARRGYGSEAVDAILGYGFIKIELKEIYGEYYHCNKSAKFWENIIDLYGMENHVEQNRKMFEGRLYPGTLFSLTRENWGKNGNGGLHQSME
jgi:RimJ/RimL family protein N-acetyltransferase